MTVVLQTPECGLRPALLLRPWGRQDAAALIDIYRDPVLRRSAKNPVTTEQDAHRWLDAQRQGWTDRSRLSFAVLDSGPASVLGHVVLKDCAAGTECSRPILPPSRPTGTAIPGTRGPDRRPADDTAHRAVITNHCPFGGNKRGRGSPAAGA